MEALKTMLSNPGSTGAILAPTYKLLTIATKKTFFECVPPEIILKYNKTDDILKLVNNSEVIFLSTEDPDTQFRGPNLGWFWLDEGAQMNRKVWNIGIGRLRQSPELAWVTTTPKGYNWVWEVFEKQRRDNYWHTTYATSENPYLTPQFIESLKEAYSGVFLEQEFYGKFVGMEGLVYPQFNYDIHVISNNTTVEFKRILAGVDFGYTNPTAVVVYGIDGDGRMYQLDEFYERQVLIPDLIEVCKRFKEQYKVESFLCDPAEPAYISQLNEAGLTAFNVKCEVIPSISKMASRLEVKADSRARYYIKERCLNTINEFRNYRYKEVWEGRPILDKPLKLFDHALDATRLVCWYLDSGIDYSKVLSMDLSDFTETM